ncbi:MAG: SIS domain-containing protein [Tetrasphaera sp.]|jgi:glucosamine--fructose-6-phosphate aminotransferase (isomerizing)|nr:SIS domain-containing protein [Tetrasphaera sp.]
MTSIPHATSVKTLAEIHSQPRLWERAIALGAAGVVGIPSAGERVLVLGCGTSYYVGLAYAEIRESAGLGITDVLIASEVPRVFRPYDRVVAISRSGTSSELLDAVRAIRTQQPDVPITALLGEQGTPLADLVTDVVDLSFADEESVVQTRFPTTQLALLRTAMAEQTRGGEASAYDWSPLADLAALPALGDHALATALPDTGIRQLVVLATGWARHIAEEGALKVRESSGMWVESYAVGEYRHGPVATCAPGTLVWGLDVVPADIVEVVESAGGRVEHGGGEPLAELVRLHRYAVALATAAGRDADTPNLLSRSVVLDAGTS